MSKLDWTESTSLDGLDRRSETLENHLEGRIDTLEKHVGETVRCMRNEIEARFDAVRSDIKRLDILPSCESDWPPWRRSSLKLVKLACRKSGHLRFNELQHESVLRVIYLPEGLGAWIVGITQHI